MLLTKKVSMGMGFVRKATYEYDGHQYEADIKDGDTIAIVNAGAVVPGQYGDQHIFAVKTRNGEKAMAFNQVTQNNLIEAFGPDTEGWKGKEVKVWIVKAMVGGKMQKIAYLADPAWTMDEETGNFEPNGVKSSKSGEEDDIIID